jgi:hypothetical protein
LTEDQLEKTFNLADVLSMEDLSVAASILASYDLNIEVLLPSMQKAVG